jgi:hypothetical protein
MFGVIPRLCRLNHGGRPAGLNAGQQDGALDLRARHFGAMRDPMQLSAVNRERRTAVGRIDAAPHAPERIDNPSHGTAGQRRVPDDTRDEWLCRHHTRQHAHRRAGIAGIERARGRTQTAEASSDNENVRDIAASRRVFRDTDTQASQACKSGMAVCARRVIAQARRSGGQRRQECVSMRDRLVAGHPDTATDAMGRSNDGGNGARHGRDLSPRTTPSHNRWYPLDSPL